MAQIVANATKMGAPRANGAQPYQVARGSGVSGAVTVAFDNTQITTRGQVLDAVRLMLPTFGDQLK